MKKYLAEFIGTAVLVLFGCGSVVVTGLADVSHMWFLAVAFAFGLSVTAMAYGIGPISGCHINPAVSLGVWAARRLPTSDLVGYIVAQVLGGIFGAALLYFLMSGKVGGYDVAAFGLGQNGWGEGFGRGFGISTAILAELIGTFVFLVVILGATGKAGATPVAGLAIGLTLVLIHIVFIPATGVSVNPARSIGPAVFVGGKALEQLWLFVVIPPIGGLLAGLLFRAKVLED
ncbi:aquaporin Z [Ancylobacter sp. 3268]|uniref:MIP family channel protein n=1 Tax=Ancylobacter sp. 3268 TaxID=2817752 RepID=UPI0028548789|nr:MIP family channel protein [Ancylobacter sp. 3268]MDR6951899.1 aquaporin Z [Ancylobacter sp. 3268]